MLDKHFLKKKTCVILNKSNIQITFFKKPGFRCELNK